MNRVSDDDLIPIFQRVLDESYGLDGSLRRLPGENYNYLVEAADGRYVLKAISAHGKSDTETLQEADLEGRLAREIAAADIGLEAPEILPTATGDAVATHADHPALRIRLFSFVSGTPWQDATADGDEPYRALGETIAHITKTLRDVKHAAADRTHRWDLTRADTHRDKISLIDDPGRRRILETVFHRFAAWRTRTLDALPRAIIHGDLNDENLLTTDGRITGLLDFGDSLLNPKVCELAIALAYAMLDQDEPLAIGREIVHGYHAVRPLAVAELRALYPFVCARLATTVLVAAERRLIDPQNPTWFGTEPRAWRLLERIAATPPGIAARVLAAGTGIDPLPNEGASPAELLSRRAKCIGPSLSIAYDRPLKIVRGRGQYLFDETGEPYLDLVNNVCHVGHCHPHVVAAGQRQMERLNTNTRYLYDGLTDYAERLCATLPPALDTCYLLNSGSEANELALRLAWAATGQRDLLVVDGAYHGHTAGLIDISPYKFMGKGGTGRAEPWVHVVPVADGYRGKHKGQGREAGVAYGDEVGRLIETLGHPIAGFISESLLSCGGQVIPPEGYLQTAYRHVRAAGGVCIADEVQVGFGRVGSHFWAFEMQGVVPDIVVMGKPIGNGHPLAAVVTTRAIADAFANGMEFFATFGGNPVSCAIGQAVLDVVEAEALQAHAHEVGTRLIDGMRSLMPEQPLIGDVRGVGLFVGIELVRDRATLEPATTEARMLINRLRERGMLLSTDGPHDNVIKIKPPMVLDAGDVDMLVRSFADELASLD